MMRELKNIRFQKIQGGEDYLGATEYKAISKKAGLLMFFMNLQIPTMNK